MQNTNPDHQQARAAPTSMFLTLRNGLQQHVSAWEAQQKIKSPCILLHGFTNDTHVWERLAGPLSVDRSVYAVDFRGHGDSDWDPDACYNHYSLMDDLHETIEQLGLGQCCIVAHSLGARIAMLYVAQYQPELGGLIIIDTGPEVGAAGVNKVRQDAQNMPTHFAGVEAYTDHLAGIYLLASRDNVAQLLAKHGLRKIANGDYIAKTDPAFTAALWHPQSKHQDARDLRMPLNDKLWAALASIHAPTLLVRGQLSAILSRQSAHKMVDDVMPNARLCVIPRAGHAVMLDNPSVLCEEILGFFTELP